MDSSPPSISRLWLNTPTSYAATMLSQLQPHWDLVLDEESGVTDLYWALGSASGQSNLLRWMKLNVTATTAILSMPLDIPDGQPLVLSLMVGLCLPLSIIILFVYQLNGYPPPPSPSLPTGSQRCWTLCGYIISTGAL